MAFSCYALIFFAPISTALIESFAGLGIAAYFVKHIALCYFQFFKIKRHRESVSWPRRISIFVHSFKPVSTPQNIPTLLFILVSIISIFRSQFFSISFEAFFFKLVQHIMLFFIMVESINSRDRLKSFVLTFFVSIAVIAINGLFQLFSSHDFIRGFSSVDGRIVSSFKHPNDFGSYLVIVVLFLFNYLVFLFASAAQPKRMKDSIINFFAKPFNLWILFLFVLSFICLGLTYSRGAWLGGILGFIFSCFYRKKKIFVPLLFIILFMAIFSPSMAKIRNVSFITDSVVFFIPEDRPDMESPAGFMGHLKIFGGMGRNSYWQDTYKIIKDFPILGTGLNTYMRILQRYNIKWSAYPHNCYLQMMAETGIVGLFAFLWMVISLFRTSFRSVLRLDDPFPISLIIGSMSGLFAFLVHSTFDTNLYSVQLVSLFWLFMGFSMAVQRIYLGADELDNISEKRSWLSSLQSFALTLKRFFKIVLLNLFILLILFAVGEICFRIFRGPPPHLTHLVQREKKALFEPNQNIGSASDILGEFDYKAHINHFGYRGRDFNFSKEKGRLRIFAVGDSFTFGVGSNDDQTIPSLIEQNLKEKGVQSEVINAGIGHASPITHYVNLRDMHLQYDPDMVLLLFDLTDLWDDWHTERNAIYDANGEIIEFNSLYVDGKKSRWLACVNYSAFCKYVNDKIVRSFRKLQLLGFREYLKVKQEGKRAKAVIINSRDIESEEVIMEYDGLLMLRGLEKKALIDKQWKRTKKYLLKINNLLKERNIPMVLIMYPHGIYVGKDQWAKGRETWGFEADKLYTDYYPFELVESFAKENGIPFINTLGAFPLNSSEKFFFNWDGHMTPAGNKIVAKGVVDSPVLEDVVKPFMPPPEAPIVSYPLEDSNVR
ncbi:MAG: O-antigen ligase family protein [Candidatus Omnitrophota bacterium]|nr:O-antigen ligase family protein [Candidatus Omnitrophota bacterium]